MRASTHTFARTHRDLHLKLSISWNGLNHLDGAERNTTKFFHIRPIYALISAVYAENYPLSSEQHVFGINVPCITAVLRPVGVYTHTVCRESKSIYRLVAFQNDVTYCCHGSYTSTLDRKKKKNQRGLKERHMGREVLRFIDIARVFQGRAS